ncbi:MAG: tetratricopeptide repeat protein [Puniceicoccales bacterium]|nr:tetratricopeptide repeat protein [Puniceicoccales bacterium]
MKTKVLGYYGGVVSFLLVALFALSLPASELARDEAAGALAPAFNGQLVAAPGKIPAHTLVYNEAEGWRLLAGFVPAGESVKTQGQLQIALERLNEARREQNAGSNSSALSLYKKITEDYPGTEFAAEAFFQRGNIYYTRNQFTNSFQNYEDLIHKHPEDIRFDQVIAAQFTIASDIKDGARPYLWGWMPWFRNTVEALDFFEKVNRNAPYGEFAARALYSKGLLAVDEGKTEEAIDAFERIIHNYPSAPEVPEAYLSLANTYENDIPGAEWDQGATRLALEYYSEFIIRFPSHPKAKEAVEGLSRMRETLAKNRYDLALLYYEEHNNARAAAIYFNEAINAAPESTTAQDARKKINDIRDGKLANRGIMDWIFGRYPVTKDADYIPPPAPTDLQNMGFGQAVPKAE